MMRRTRFRYLAALALLVLVGFLVRAVSLDTQSLWRDEVDAVRFATLPWSDMLNNFTRPGWNGPLFYVLLRGWIALAGTSEYALRFFSLVFGVLCLPLIYVLGDRLFSSTVGRVGALLMTLSPYLVWYSQEAKMYTLVLVLALLAIYSLRRALEGNGWLWWLAQIVGTTLAFYSHILAAFLIPGQVLLTFAWWPEARKRWRGALVSLACLTLPYLPLLVWQAPLALQARDTGFHPYSLNQMVVILLKAWSTGMTSWGAPWGPALLGLLAALGLLRGMARAVQPILPMIQDAGRSLVRFLTSPSSSIRAAEALTERGSGGVGNRCGRPQRRTGGNGQVVLLIWLVVPMLCVWLISLRQPLFTDRYLIWSAPAFYLLVADTLAWFASAEDASRWVAVALVGVTMVLSGFNVYEQATQPIKSEFRAAAAFVADYREPPGLSEGSTQEGQWAFKSYLPLAMGGEPGFDDLIIFQIPYGRYTFDYYFPIEGYPWAEGLYTNHRAANGAYQLSARQAAERMEQMTEGYDTVWLVATEVLMWDERNLVQQWLDEHARRDAVAYFTRVDVYRYVWCDR